MNFITYVCKYECVHIYIYICIYICVCVCVCVQVCVCVCVRMMIENLQILNNLDQIKQEDGYQNDAYKFRFVILR